MTVIVCMDEAGTIWIANGQGDMLAECFFKTEDETERVATHGLSPSPHGLSHGISGRRGELDPAELGEVFLEGGRQLE